jgi:uncharacterized membrane protein
MTRRTARRLTVAAVAAIAAAAAVAAILVLSAGGGTAEGDGVASAGGKDSAATPAETEKTAPLDPDAQALVFAGCVRDNGVDMPDPGPGQQGLVDAFRAVSGDYDRATLEQALAACQDLMPQYAQEHPTGDDWMLALAECLREQGLDVSDNPFQDAHSGAVDVNEFSKAMEVCRDELTGGGR